LTGPKKHDPAHIYKSFRPTD